MTAVANMAVDDTRRRGLDFDARLAPVSQRRKCLLAGRDYEAGEPVLSLDHVTWCSANCENAVEHPSGRRFRDPLLEGVVQSDDPNCRLSFELMVLIARRDIRSGEIITNDFMT